MCRVIAFLFLLAPVAAWAEPVEWPVSDGGNGHFYELIEIEPAYSWAQARDLAAAMSHGGLVGHLLTINSQAEDIFIRDTWSATGGWTGGLQEPGSPEPDGGWGWVTGEDWYDGWFGMQPDDCCSGVDGEENYLWNWGGAWNDSVGECPDGCAFFVEYEGTIIDTEGTSFGSVKSLYR